MERAPLVRKTGKMTSLIGGVGHGQILAREHHLGPIKFKHVVLWEEATGKTFIQAMIQPIGRVVLQDSIVLEMEGKNLAEMENGVLVQVVHVEKMVIKVST